MKTPFIYLFLGAGLLCTVPAAARTLTLEACREAAAEHNRTLQNSRPTQPSLGRQGSRAKVSRSG